MGIGRIAPLACIGLFACTSIADEDIEVKRTYADTVEKLNLTAVYPPRENIQVGDIFFRSFETAKGTNSAETMLVYSDRAAVDSALNNLHTRVQFDIAGETASYTGSPFPSDRRGTPNDPGHVLPIVGFPKVTVDLGYSAAFGQSGIGRAFGIGGGERSTVELEFLNVSTYGIPAREALDRSSAYLGQLYASANAPIIGCPQEFADFATGACTQNNHQRNQTAFTFRTGEESPCTDGRSCNYAYVGRIYVATEVQYTYSNARLIALAAQQLAQEEAAGASARGAAPVQNVTVNVSTPDEAAADTENDELKALIADLKAQIDNITPDSPGQKLSFSGWSQAGVTFTRKYPRPVAIAWEGVTVRVP